MSLFMAKVRDLIEQRPEWIWKMFNQNRQKLYQEISDAVDRALAYKERLEKIDLPPGGLDELVYNSVAPVDVEPAYPPMKEERVLEILEWANDPPEARTATT